MERKETRNGGLYLDEGQLAKPSFSSSHISTTDPKSLKRGLCLWLSLRIIKY